MRSTILSCLLVAAACAACESTSETGTTGAIENAWSEAGLEVGTWSEHDGDQLGGGSCRRAPIEGLEVTLCSYETPDRAAAARPAGLALVGKTTGAALVEGRFLLVVADRDEVDRHGKTLNQVARTFQQASGPSTDEGAKAQAPPVPWASGGE